MYQQLPCPVVTEPSQSYKLSYRSRSWVEVLVDCPGTQELYTYSLPRELVARSGDIVSVPFGARTLGGIVIRTLSSIPNNLSPERIRDIEEIIAPGFFPPHYWQLLNQVSQYYCTPLIRVIRVALPPGLLRGSQRRLRLVREAIPQGAEVFCSPPAREILQLLHNQTRGDYSAQYLQRRVSRGSRGIQELVKRGWVESYLEPPKPARPKLKQAVTLVNPGTVRNLTDKQREVLRILARQGGELWLQELLQMSHSSSSVVKSLAHKGYVVIQQREVLRTLQQPATQKDEPKELTTAQALALSTINQLQGTNQILLHGVTGSGKTEVYLQAIAKVITQEKSALVLVPEIGLTPQLTDRFRARFGSRVSVYHSALSQGERYDTWRNMLQNEPQIVIGTRSAVFAPLPQLGLIILDEEHDSSYKQDRLAPTYHARTVAQWRSQLENCPLILGSATPSLSSWVQARAGDNHNSHYLSLPQRIQSRPLPAIEVVDMRRELHQGNRSLFSRSLQEALQQLLARKEQGILFIPRRGHSTFVSCRSCGHVIECPNCDVSLSYHHTHETARELLRCHYCNHTQLQPPQCPQCGSPYLKHFGSGTQRVARELGKLFPEMRFLRFDSDTTRTKGAHRNLLTRFLQREAELLIGTQMLTKGLDIAQITLVGIVAADGLLYQEDYSASERAFQTLTQVAGRTGRGAEPGRVILQTYSPEHAVIEAVRGQNYENFTAQLLSQRQAFAYPPYSQLILLQLSGVESQEVEQNARELALRCQEFLDEEDQLLGPAPARIMRIARRFRWQILLKLTSGSEEIFTQLEALKNYCPPSVSLIIDVDPLSMD